MRQPFLYTCNTSPYSCFYISPMRKPLLTIWCIFLGLGRMEAGTACTVLLYFYFYKKCDLLLSTIKLIWDQIYFSVSI